jgi:hypothetical protein
MWFLAVVGGPLLLGLVIYMGVTISRRRRRDVAASARTEEGTRQIYRETERKASRDNP